MHDGHAHTHEGFDYHKPANTLVFIASPETDLPNKFEGLSSYFSPESGGQYEVLLLKEEEEVCVTWTLWSARPRPRRSEGEGPDTPEGANADA